MKFTKRYLPLIILFMLVGVSSLYRGTAHAQNNLSYSDTDGYTLEESDSITALRDSMYNGAIECYKSYTTATNEGQDPSATYPILLETYDRTLAAMDVVNFGSSSYLSLKEVLREINPELEMGAYYYSGKSDRDNMNRMARAYVDTHLMKAFEGEKFRTNPSSYPSIVYIAASDAYNRQEYDQAIEYFKTYFATGATDKREQVYIFMGQACLNSGRYELALSTMAEGVKLFPANRHLALIGITAAIESGHSEYLQSFLDCALAVTPDDVNLLNIQGKLLEDVNDYKKALVVYERIDQLDPNTLNAAKHIGLNYYNLAAVEYNQSVNDPNEKEARKSRTRARNYFSAAASKFEEVIAADPTSAKYLRALAICYLCLEDKEHFDSFNSRLQALGEEALTEAAFMPGVMTANADNATNYEGQGVTGNGDVPLFSEFGKEYIVSNLKKFLQKGEFERTEDYLARVNDKTIGAEYLRLNEEAAAKYMDTYAKKLRLSDLKLKPYDANNETFLIETSFGPVYLPVPAAEGKAQNFKTNWAAVKVRAPQYFIEGSQIRIAQLSFQMPDGTTYTYDNAHAAEYKTEVIEIDVNDILAQYGQHSKTAENMANDANRVKVQVKSDVDDNIPVTNVENPNTFVLIFANENYTQGLSKVQSAIHDGEVFRDYCIKTLGVPKENIILQTDATLGNMIGSLDRLKRLVAPYHGDAQIMFYYAGHGMPDEATRDAFLLPVDGSATISTANLSLAKLYDTLGEMESTGVIAFIDACFSGAQRGEGMLAEARAVALKAKESAPKGNMFVMSAASGQETAMPYKEKNHGLFTYFLLKKLQESKGNTTLRDLSDYVINNVSKSANRINNKPQTPTVSTSGMNATEWYKRKLRK